VERPRELRVTTLAVALIAFLYAVPAAACDGNSAPSGAAAFEHDQSLPSFTFNLDVAMAMRHFPWLHFHMLGVGKYQPGKAYSVHFTDLPWFAPRPQHDADLSMIDPAMWPTRFTYEQAGQENGNTLYRLHSIDDPSLTNAVVGLGPKWCAREVEATYNDGTHIKMEINFGMVDGFLLPATLSAEIDEPHLALSANGQFKNYTFDVNIASSASGIPGVRREGLTRDESMDRGGRVRDMQLPRSSDRADRLVGLAPPGCQPEPDAAIVHRFSAFVGDAACIDSRSQNVRRHGLLPKAKAQNRVPERFGTAEPFQGFDVVDAEL
jgi:hypothetical protein